MSLSISRALAGAGLVALISTGPAKAHHPGGSGNTGSAGPINTIGAETLAQGQSTVAFLFEYTVLNTMSDASLAYYAGKHLHVHSMAAIASPAVSVAYGVTNDLTVSARLPYVQRSDIREGFHEHVAGVTTNSAVDRGDASGLGDASLLAHYRLVNNRDTGTQWALLAGVKAPTGRTGLKDKNGEIFEAEFSPGSGSWDWSAGLAVSQSYGRYGVHANVLQTWVGRSAWDGIDPTRLGDRFQYNLAGTYRIVGSAGGAEKAYTHIHADGSTHVHKEAPAAVSGPTLDIMLELNGEIHEHQKSLGVIDTNSGGHTAYLAPGVRLSNGRWSAFASVGIPVINDQTGKQAEPGVRALTGVAISF
jgi:hypothetical protein